MKKFIAVFLGCIGLFLFLVLTVPYLFRNTIKEKVLEAIDKKIDAEFTFRDFSVSSILDFPQMTLHLRDFCIMGKEDFAGDTLAYAKVVSVSLEYASLLKGKEIDIKRIHLNQPLVNLRTLSNGDVNYDILLPDSTAAHSPAFNVTINQWVIENGRFTLYDRPQRSYLELSGINHSGDGDFTHAISDLRIRTSVEAISYSLNGIKYLDRKKLATNLVMEMNLSEHKFTFKDHVFEINHFKFGFEGYLKFPKKGYEVDLRLLVNQTDFKNFLSLMPGFYVEDFKKMNVTGDFTLDGHVKGIYDFASHRIPSFALDLKVKNGGFKYEHLPKAMEHITLDFMMRNETGIPDETTFDFRNFSFEINKSPVEGNLRVTGMKAPFINGEINVDVDLAELEKLYPLPGITLKGKLRTDIKVNGRYAREKNQFPFVDASLQLDSGYLRSADYSVPMEHIQIDAEVLNPSGRLEDTQIDLHAMTYQIEGESFSMSGSIRNLTDYDYDLTIDGLIDFEKLMKIYPVEGIALTGAMDVHVKTSGKVSDLEARRFDLLTSSGSIEIRNINFTDRELSKSIALTNGTLHFTPESIALQNLNGRMGRTHFVIQGHLFDYMPALLRTGKAIKGDLDLKCDTLDFNEQLVSGNDVPDSSRSSLKILEIPKGIDFTFDAAIGFVKFHRVNMDDLKGGIRLKDGILTLNETGFTSQGAKFTVNGNYNTNDLNHPGFDMKIDIDKLDINKGLQLFQTKPTDKTTDGLFSTQYHLKGELAADYSLVLSTLAGNGTIIIEDAQVKGMKVLNHVSRITKKAELNDAHVQDIVMETEIKGGKLLIKPFSFLIGKYRTELEGSQGFDDVMDYVLRISVPPLNKIKIPFHISGTLSKPVVKVGKGHEQFDFSTF